MVSVLTRAVNDGVMHTAMYGVLSFYFLLLKTETRPCSFLWRRLRSDLDFFLISGSVGGAIHAKQRYVWVFLVNPDNRDLM